MTIRLRGRARKALDFVTFPLRALMPAGENHVGLTSRRNERFDYVAREVRGRVLDIGCGPHNLFVRRFVEDGVGIDVFPYDGLAPDQMVEDMTCLPFDDGTFDSVTFIANFNHIPRPDRIAELREAYRVLRPHGTVVITMGSKLAEVLIHRLVHLYDRVLGTRLDVDTERGMHEDEDLHVDDDEIIGVLFDAGFVDVRRRRFLTQWGLNHLFVAIRG